MAVYKMVFQFTQPDKGFSEVYYRVASDLAGAAEMDLDFRQRAVRFRTNLTVLRKVRISNVANNRDAVVVNINLSTDVPIQEPDIAGAAGVYTLVSTSPSGRRSVWFRGLNDNSIKRNQTTGVDVPGAAFTTGVQDWLNALATQGFVIRMLTKVDGITTRFTPITSIVVSSTQFVEVNMPVGWTLNASGRVIISQLDEKLFPGLNGHWTAQNVVGTSFTVAYKSPLPAQTYFLTKGRLRPEEYVTGAISSTLSTFNHFSTRDTGKNPLGGRGRRSTKLRR